jgi:chromosome segregation ATPase
MSDMKGCCLNCTCGCQGRLESERDSLKAEIERDNKAMRSYEATQSILKAEVSRLIDCWTEIDKVKAELATVKVDLDWSSDRLIEMKDELIEARSKAKALAEFCRGLKPQNEEAIEELKNVLAAFDGKAE